MALERYIAASNLPQVQAFRAVLDDSEGTHGSYTIICGGGRFSDFSRHPRIYGCPNSTAAGRYQFTWSTWRDEIIPVIGSSRFDPALQDLGFVILLDKIGALSRLRANDFRGAVQAARGRWPSLPGGIQQQRNWTQSERTYYNALGVAPPASPSQSPIIQTSYNAPTINTPVLGIAPDNTSTGEESDTTGLVIAGAFLFIAFIFATR